MADLDTDSERNRRRTTLQGVRFPGTSFDWRVTLAETPTLLYGAVLVGGLLRLYRLPSESLWVDEATAIAAATLPVPELLVALPRADSPLYYLLLGGWFDLVGVSEATARLPSAAFGVATIAMLYVVSARLFDERTALLSAILLAISPFHVWYSQEARMFSLFGLLALLSFYWFLRFEAERSSRNAVGYVVTTALLCYTHAFGLFVVLAQALYLGTYAVVEDRSRAELRPWATVGGAVFALLSPWLAVRASEALAAGGGSGAAQETALPTFGALRATFLAYLTNFSEGAFPVLLPAVAVACLALALFRYEQPRDFERAFESAFSAALDTVPDRTTKREFAGGMRRRFRSEFQRSFVDADDEVEVPSLRRSVLRWLRAPGSRSVALLLLWVAVPVLAPFVVSHFGAPIYATRYTIVAALGFYVMLAKGAGHIERGHVRYLVVVLLVVGLFVPLASSYATDEKDQWREAAAHVGERADGGDIVLVHRPDGREAFSYYFSRSDVAVDVIPPDMTRDELREAVWGHDEVWVVLSDSSAGMEAGIDEVLSEQSPDVGPAAHRTYLGIDVYRFRLTRDA